MHKLLAFLMVFMTLPLYGAEVYKTYDQYGNPVFSDQPSDDAEKLEVEEVMTVPAFEGAPPPRRTQEPVQRYRQLSITNPKNEQTYFRSEGDLVISAQLIPRLRGSDNVVFYLDGRQVYSGKSTSFSIAEMDRGIHTVSVGVVDAAGNEIKRSEPVTFYMRQASRLNNPN